MATALGSLSISNRCTLKTGERMGVPVNAVFFRRIANAEPNLIHSMSQLDYIDGPVHFEEAEVKVLGEHNKGHGSCTDESHRSV